jgi:hypothetical protein
VKADVHNYRILVINFELATQSRRTKIRATREQTQLKDGQGEQFFFVMGVVLIAIVIAGFVPPVLARPGGATSLPVLLHVHGAVFVSWFLIFSAQARLAGSGNLSLHVRLGKVSVLVAAAMVILGYFVIRGAYANPDWSIAEMSGAASVMFPFTDILNFTIVYSLALANRRNPAAHKRLMLLAGILIIDPAVARLVMTLGAVAPLIVMIELALFGALLSYDFITRRRPSWTSLLGIGLFAAALVAKLTVSQHAIWRSFVDFVFT